MKKFLFLLLPVLLGLSVIAQPKKKKVLVIVTGEIPANTLEKARPSFVQSIGRASGYKAMATDTLSETDPNNMVTGTWENKHTPDIFRLMKQPDSTKKTAIFSSTPSDYQADYHIGPNEKPTDAAEKCIREQAPDLVWVKLGLSEDPTQPASVKASIDYTDKQVTRLWNALQYRQQQFNEDWLILVTAGRSKSSWILTNSKDLNHYWRDYDPVVVDIVPTIASHLGINIPRDLRMEFDGAPLIGKIAVALPVARLGNNKIDLRWKTFDKEGTVKIWLATTDNFNFNTGGKDNYKLLAQFPGDVQSAVLSLSSYPSHLYKIVLEGSSNITGRRINLP